MNQNSSKTCPVCEANIPEENEKCPECGILIEIFDVDIGEEVPKKSIERVKELIIEEEDDEELIEVIKGLEPIDEALEEEVEEVEEIVTFACPICDSEVGEDAAECPNCGAIFEVEEEVEEEGIEEESNSIDIEDELESFEGRIDRYENAGLDMGYLKNDLNELKSASETGERTKVEELSQQIKQNLDYSERIKESMAKVEYYLEALEEKSEFSEFEEEINRICKGCELGEYKTASKKAEQVEKRIERIIGEEIDEIWLEELVEEKSEQARNDLSDIEEIDTSIFQKNIERAISIKNEGEMAESLHQIMKTYDSISKAYEINEKINEAKGLIDQMEQEENASEFDQRIETVKEKIKDGEKEVAHKAIEDLVPQLENRLEEEKESEEEKQTEDEIGEEKVEEKISKMRSLLDGCKDFDIEIDDWEEIIELASEQKEDGKYKEGMSQLEEFKEQYVKRFEERIKERKDDLKERFGEEEFEEEFPQDEVDDLMEEDKYEEALSLVQEQEEHLESLQKRKEKLSENISRIEGIIEDAGVIDFDIEEIEENLEDAKHGLDDKNFEGTEDHIKNCEGKLQQKLVGFLKGEVQNAKEKLKGIRSEDVDVKKIIGHLKKANKAKKKEQLEKGFKALKKYKKEMDGISEL